VLSPIACGRQGRAAVRMLGFSSGLAAQVDARANQLAHHLIAQGASLGSAVGLLLEPSMDAIIAMLAVLKAGCCYLPLQQHCSDAALALVAEDASLAVAVAHRGLQRRLPVGHAVRAVALDAPREEAAIRRRPTHSPGRRAAPVDAAYVLFFQAAGATRPTGTVHQHAGLADMRCAASGSPSLWSRAWLRPPLRRCRARCSCWVTACWRPRPL
jgi:non-ribosomal peptide synthetase component F